MTSSKPNITLYQQAKAGLKSLFVQTAQVSIGLIIMLVATGGNPPGWLVSTSFFFGVGFVAWSENKRQSEFKNQNGNLDIEPNDITSRISLFSGSVGAAATHGTVHAAGHFAAHAFGYDVFHYSKIKLKEGVELWNRWRIENPDIKPNLVGADLKYANLIGADFKSASLVGANLEGANLIGADFKSASLVGANLEDANLKRADLSGAIVYQARFGSNLGIDDQLRQDLIKRGAIFVDSPEDQA